MSDARLDHAVLRWGRPVGRSMLLEAKALLGARPHERRRVPPVDEIEARPVPPMDPDEGAMAEAAWFLEEHQFVRER